MSGINDIKNAFAKAAPGIDLRAVRMRYDHNMGEQVLEFDICGPDGSKRTVEERLPNTAGMNMLLDAAMKVAKALGAKVEVQDSTPAQVNPLAEKAAEGIAQLFAEADGSSVERASPVGQTLAQIGGVPEIEHKGEKYELAHDGQPHTLFF